MLGTLTAAAGGAFALAAAGAAAADVPRVVVDVAPAHSLAARVMEGVGEPALIVREGASPHGYSLRPSEAAALQEAEVAFWVSPALTPWLEGALDRLAGDARRVELIEVEGLTRLEFRENARFPRHDHDEGHGHDEDGHDGHEHEDHDDHAGHDDNDDHAEHADHGGHDGHAHEGVDPHAWLDPENARLWLSVIAETLAEADPEHAGAYRANAQAARAEIAALSEEIAARIAPVRGRPYIVFHDAYQYFEARFDIPAAGAISLGDASDPSPSRVAEIRDAVSELGAVCVFSEPQFNPGLVRAVFEGEAARTATLDPLGLGLTPGPELYPALMRRLSDHLADCLR